MTDRKVISRWEVYYRETNRIVKGFRKHTDAIVCAHRANDMVFFIPYDEYYHYWIYDGHHRDNVPSTMTDDNMYAIVRPEGWSDEWVKSAEKKGAVDE
jgi:hypothetical protein